MSTAKELPLSKDQKSILNTVLPGGNNWHSYLEKSDGDCKKTCPHYKACWKESGGYGPNGICSDNWQDAELDPLVLSVLFHVINNFDFYNKKDEKEITQESNEVISIRELLFEITQGENDGKYREGGIRLAMHKYRERSSEAAKLLKQESLNRNELCCEACKKDFFASFGQAATRIVECHHNKPLSSKYHKGTTEKKDLVLLCANCHRLAHSSDSPDRPYSLNELRARFSVS